MPTYEEISKIALGSFLNTAIVVDDSVFAPLGGVAAPVAAGAVVQPGRGVIGRQIAEAPARAVPSRLNAKALVNSFADIGVVCSVVEPVDSNDAEDKIERLVGRADVVVLDWDLFGDRGATVVGVVSRVFESIENKFLMICVYTSEPNLSDVGERIQQCSDGLSVRECGFIVLKKGATVVAVLAKSGTNVTGEYVQSVVSEEVLPSVLLDIFSKESCGLLTNAALVALDGIRRNAHEIVGRFSGGLDYAYVTHKILSNPTYDVPNHVPRLILSEVECAVERSRPQTYVDGDAIVQWLDDYALGKSVPATVSTTPESFSEGVRFLAREGIAGVVPGAPAPARQIKSQIDNAAAIRGSKLTKALGCSRPGEADHEFAILSTVLTRHADYNPVLRQGAIVHSPQDGYMVCIMPPCSCLRVPVGGRKFPFLKLPVAGNNANLVINDGGRHVQLSFCYDPFEVVHYYFTPNNENREVCASMRNGVLCFLPRNHRHKALRWIADVRSEVAQMLVNTFASNLSRVGITQSEWLRKLDNR